MTGDSYAPISKEFRMAAPLPTSWTISRWIQARTRMRPRQFFVTVIMLIHLLFLVTFLHRRDWRLFAYPEEASWASDATNFDSIFIREAELPQHNLSAPYPEGKKGRYLRFSNQVWGSGWNNLLQERLMNTILAYETDRAPVFSPFEAWAHPPRDDTTTGGQRTVLVIPYNALLSGPTSGMSWGPGDHHPRAVSQNYWEVVCPTSERRIVDADEVMKVVGRESDGIRMLTEWANLIQNMQERCVEIKGTQTFDVFLFGSSRVLSLWDTFKSHPTVRFLEDSEVVKNAVSKNMAKLQPVSGAQRPFVPKSTGLIEGLLGIHIRRGDFRGDSNDNGHCLHLAKWASTYSGWNQLPQLHDKHVDPPRDGVEWGHYTPTIKDYYFKHCLPTPEQVASRIRQIREETHARISHIFIATDAEEEFLTELRRVLAIDGWGPEKISTSKDLELNWQATSVNNVVDMSILARAEVFIGNGWSSMTSNVVMRRLTTGRSPENTRLW
ncbi:unnamed protein product [Rhizoctonia solani]|uniref:GDP-fucose protein O-fucosyltransferase 2 n=1 Tax=Rhizoctonia solani TaxID=456999 RepID=A0A8H3C1T8_9AGAM|nr:unnamed protein product [Rhizoctonia solani]